MTDTIGGLELVTIEHLDFEPQCEAPDHGEGKHVGPATYLQLGTCDCLTGLRCTYIIKQNQRAMSWYPLCAWCGEGRVVSFIPLGTH